MTVVGVLVVFIISALFGIALAILTFGERNEKR